MNVEYMTFFVG